LVEQVEDQARQQDGLAGAGCAQDDEPASVPERSCQRSAVDEGYDPGSNPVGTLGGAVDGLHRLVPVLEVGHGAGVERGLSFAAVRSPLESAVPAPGPESCIDHCGIAGEDQG
jgi:hypothetical protein